MNWWVWVSLAINQFVWFNLYLTEKRYRDYWRERCMARWTKI